MDPVDYTLLALTIWREARSQSEIGRRAVLHVILNRVQDRRWPDTTYGVCLQPKQFSCFNANDSQSSLWPRVPDKAWTEIRGIIEAPGEDPTRGATHYHTYAVKPAWAEASKVTARIGDHVFYRL